MGFRRTGRFCGLARQLARNCRRGASMKLLDQVRHAVRAKHYSYRTEQAYVFWIERFIRHHGIRHPGTMGTAEVEQFLAHLAVERHVAASTQRSGKVTQLFLNAAAAKRAASPFRFSLSASLRNCNAAAVGCSNLFAGDLTSNSSE